MSQHFPVLVDGEDISLSDLWAALQQLVFMESQGVVNMPLAIPLMSDQDEHFAPLICKHLSRCSVFAKISSFGTVRYLVVRDKPLSDSTS